MGVHQNKLLIVSKAISYIDNGHAFEDKPESVSAVLNNNIPPLLHANMPLPGANLKVSKYWCKGEAAYPWEN